MKQAGTIRERRDLLPLQRRWFHPGEMKYFQASTNAARRNRKDSVYYYCKNYCLFLKKYYYCYSVSKLLLLIVLLFQLFVVADVELEIILRRHFAFQKIFLLSRLHRRLHQLRQEDLHQRHRRSFDQESCKNIHHLRHRQHHPCSTRNHSRRFQSRRFCQLGSASLVLRPLRWSTCSTSFGSRRDDAKCKSPRSTVGGTEAR